MKLDLNVSKGMGIQMVFFAISMASVIAGLAAFAQAQKLPPAFGQTVDELGSVTKPEHRLEDTVNHYIPLSAHYGVAEAAYNISTNNTNFTGHADSHVSTGPTEGGDDADEMERYTDMIDYVDTKSQSYFEQYIQRLDYDNCKVRIDDEAKVNLSYASTQVNVSAGTSRPLINVSCETPQIDVYTETELGKELSLNMSNLRFHELASTTVEAMKEMESVSETLEGNSQHYGSVTADSGSATVPGGGPGPGPGSSSLCGWNEDQFADPEQKAKEDAIQRGKDAALAKIQDFEKAIVSQAHGIGGAGPNRGGEKVLEDATTSNAFCVLGYCLTNFFSEDISYDIYVRNNKTEIFRNDVSTSQCGCDDYECSGADYTPKSTSSGAVCEHDAEAGVGDPLPSRDPECTDPDLSTTPSDDDCENATGAIVSEDPTCDHYDSDFEHDGSGNCVIDPFDRPSPICKDKIYSAESEFGYRYQKIDVQVNLTDEKYVIPTSEGFTNLYMNRRFIRNFEEP